MDLNEIQSVIDDWNAGCTRGQLLDKHDITNEQAFAITHCDEYHGMAAEDMAIRLKNLSPAMKAVEILEVMTT